MVCSKCGAELKEGYLFCLHCGHEVQIVPDYNPMEELVVKNLAEAQKLDWSDTREFSFGDDITKEVYQKNNDRYNGKDISDTIPFSMQELKKIDLSKVNKGISERNNLNNTKDAPLDLTRQQTKEIAVNDKRKQRIPARLDSGVQSNDFEKKGMEESGARLNHSQDKTKDKTDHKIKNWILKYKKSFVIFTSIVVVLLLLFIISSAVVKYRQDNSIDYQVALAKKYIANNQYQEAAARLEHVLILDSQSIEIRLLLVSVYEKLNNTYAESLMLNEIIQMDSENKTAYEKLIKLYTDNNMKSELAVLQEKLSKTSFADEFAKYFIPTPTFSQVAGTYDHALSVALSSEQNNEIYYTTDGSEATIHSTKYDKPIKIKSGATTIHAVAVTSDGQSSLQSEVTYTITATAPTSPTVSVPSGSYLAPLQITLQSSQGTLVYYTLDGSDPVEHGTVYHAPISLDVGEVTLKVVTVNEGGIASDVVTCQYHLTIRAQLSQDDAFNRLAGDMGLADDNGAYDFKYATTTVIEESYYYIFTKSYPDNPAANSMVAVDVNSGYHCAAVSEGAGNYVLTP